MRFVHVFADVGVEPRETCLPRAEWLPAEAKKGQLTDRDGAKSATEVTACFPRARGGRCSIKITSETWKMRERINNKKKTEKHYAPLRHPSQLSPSPLALDAAQTPLLHPSFLLSLLRTPESLFPPSLPPPRRRMLAADSMLRTPWLRLGIPGVCWIRCPRAGDFVRLGFRPRSATLEPTTEARKADSFRWMACFKDPVAKGKKVEAEYVRGGEDLWDAASASQQGGYPEHLVVMQFDSLFLLLGCSAGDWRFAAEQIVKRLPDKVLVHREFCSGGRCLLLLANCFPPFHGCVSL
ncbi:hypothetical protein BHM03_00009744 [Ensete ventricosum]|nr:hypothetical protein BHM03_00009744 [Ensete ventricosum]